MTKLKGVGPGAMPGHKNSGGFTADRFGTQAGNGPCQLVITVEPFPALYAFRSVGLPGPHGAVACWRPASRLEPEVSHL
jgi:hypothetical protein